MLRRRRRRRRGPRRGRRRPGRRGVRAAATARVGRRLRRRRRRCGQPWRAPQPTVGGSSCCPAGRHSAISMEGSCGGGNEAAVEASRMQGRYRGANSGLRRGGRLARRRERRFRSGTRTCQPLRHQRRLWSGRRRRCRCRSMPSSMARRPMASGVVYGSTVRATAEDAAAWCGGVHRGRVGVGWLRG